MCTYATLTGTGYDDGWSGIAVIVYKRRVAMAAAGIVCGWHTRMTPGIRMVMLCGGTGAALLMIYIHFVQTLVGIMCNC